MEEAYKHPCPLFRPINGVIQERWVTEDILDEIKGLPVQNGDIFITSYQKSGNTWMSEIVWQICSNGKIDERPIAERVPYLEHTKTNQNLETKNDFYSAYLQFPLPRIFKLHMPYSCMPQENNGKKPYIIHVLRNPKDVAVSYYWHYKSLFCYEFDRKWDEYFEMFIEGNVVTGNWFDFVLEWWVQRHHTNILFVKYEDMKNDLPTAIETVANFLGKALPGNIVDQISRQTSFEAMAKRDKCLDNPEDPKWKEKLGRKPGMKLLRKGEVGDWKNYFNEEQNKRFDEIYEKKLSGSGLSFLF